LARKSSFRKRVAFAAHMVAAMPTAAKKLLAQI